MVPSAARYHQVTRGSRLAALRPKGRLAARVVDIAVPFVFGATLLLFVALLRARLRYANERELLSLRREED